MQCGQDADTEPQPISSGVFLRNYRPLPTQLLAEVGPHSELGWGASVGSLSCFPFGCPFGDCTTRATLLKSHGPSAGCSRMAPPPGACSGYVLVGTRPSRGFCTAFAVLWRVASVAVRKRFLHFCLSDRVGVAAKTRDCQSCGHQFQRRAASIVSRPSPRVYCSIVPFSDLFFGDRLRIVYIACLLSIVRLLFLLHFFCVYVRTEDFVCSLRVHNS
jgi:hypothetical protein